MAKHKKRSKHKKKYPKTSRSKIVQKKKHKPDIFDKIYNDYIEKYPFQIFLGLLVCIATFVFWDFLILEKLFLFKDIGSDSINIFYPRNYMKNELSDSGLLYTFRNGLGTPIGVQGDIISQIIANVIAPHTFLTNSIIELFTEEVAYKMFFNQIVNIVLAAIIFFFYLNLLGLSKITKIAGSLIFAFCGVMILESGWFIGTRLLVYVTFMLFSFELMLKKNIWLLLPLAIFAASRKMGVFWLYPFGLMLFVYSIVRYFEDNDWHFKKFALYMLKFGGLALLGLLLNSSAIYSNVESLLNNPRVSGDASISGELANATSYFAEAQFYITALLRFFSTDMAGNGIIDKVVVEGRQYLVPSYRGWQNYYEGPAFYISILSLFLIPAFFTSSSRKHKILFGIYMAVFALPVVFPYFLKAFWAFQGTYFRAFSFVIIFPYFYTALKGLNNIEQTKKINLWTTIVTATILIALLAYLVAQLLEINPNFYNLSSTPYDTSIKNLSILILIAYTIIFIAFKFKPESKKSFLIIILGILIVELSVMSNISINDRSVVTTEEFKSKTAYKDNTVDALDYIKSIDSTFYRVEKEYKSGNAVHGSLNDAFVQGYFGTSRYSSTPDARYLRFLYGLELIKKGDASAARWMSGLRTRPLLLTFINGKYILSKNPSSQYAGFGYKKIQQTGDVHIYQNSFALPIGYTYNKFILQSDFDKLPVFQKDIALLRAALIEDSLKNELDDLIRYELSDTISGLNMNMYKEFTDSLKSESLVLTSFREDGFEGKISLSSPSLMFFSFLFDENWKIEIDEKPAETFTTNLAFTGVKIEAGEHIVKVYYSPLKKTNYFRMITNIIVLIFITFMLLVFVTGKSEIFSRQLSVAGQQ
jgi:hypothetical protein